MKSSTCNKIYEEFIKACPWAKNNVKDWFVSDDKEITIHMKDGSVMKYDYILGAFSYYANDDELRRRHSPSNEKDWCVEFANRMYRRMLMKGYTQEDLAYKTGISQASINRYVNADVVPNAYVLNKIAKALGCTPDYLSNF